MYHYVYKVFKAYTHPQNLYSTPTPILGLDGVCNHFDRGKMTATTPDKYVVSLSPQQASTSLYSRLGTFFALLSQSMSIRLAYMLSQATDVRLICMHPAGKFFSLRHCILLRPEFPDASHLYGFILPRNVSSSTNRCMRLRTY